MANKYSKSGRIIPTFNRDEYLANVLNKPTTAENNTLVQEESNQDKGNFLLRAGSTISDVTENFATGVGSAFEGIFDFATSLVSGTFKLFGNNEISDQINDFIKKDYIKDAFTTMGKQTDLFTLGWTIKDAIEGKEDAWTTNLFEKINRGADVEDMSYLSELPDNVEDTVRGGIQSVGQMVPSIAMGNIGGQVASLSTLGLSATGNATKEGLEESNDIGKSLAYGIGSGAIEVASELVVGKALSKLGLGTGKILGVVGKDGAKQIGKKGATRVITDLLKTFNEEGVEEVFSDILNPVLKKLTINQDQSIEDIFNNNGGVNGLLESYLVGGTIGALFGGAEVTSGAKTFKGINNYYAYQDAQAILETRNEIAEEMQKTKGESSKKLERLQTKLAEQENSFRKNFEGFLDKIIKNPKILQEYRDNTQLVSDALADKDYIQKQLVEKNLNGANIEYVKGKEYSSYNPSTNTYKINLDKAKTLKGLKSVIMHEYGHNLASTKDNATRVNSVNDYVEKDLGINKSSKEYKDYKAKYSKEAEAFMDNNFSNLSKDSEEYKTQYKAYINEEIAMDSLAKQNLSLNDYQRIIGNEPKSKIKRFINRFIDIIENHTESKNYNATKKFLKQLSTKAELESDYVEQRLADVRAKKDTRKTSQDNVNRDVKKQKFDDEVFDKWLDELLLEDDDYDLLKKYEDIPSVQYGWNNDYSKFYWNGKEIKNRYRIEQLEQRMEEQQPSTNKIEVANNPTPRTLNIAPLNLFKQSNTKIMEFRNSGKYARLSSERLQNEIERSKARFSPDYAKEYITQISPQEFLEMTKGTESVLQDPGDDSSAKLGVLDLDKLTKDRQTPYLIINQSTKEIIGHEGRHRMYALMKAGYTKADVLLIGSSLDKSYDKYNTKPINDVIFKSQMFSSGRASNQRLKIINATPLSERYENDLINEYKNKKSDIRYQKEIDSKGNKVYALPKEVKDKFDKYFSKWNTIERVSVDKLYNDNNLGDLEKQDSIRRRRSGTWGDDVKDYKFNDKLADKEAISYETVISITEVDGKYRLRDGNHRVIALKNEGYKYVDVSKAKPSDTRYQKSVDSLQKGNYDKVNDNDIRKENNEYEKISEEEKNIKYNLLVAPYLSNEISLNDINSTRTIIEKEYIEKIKNIFNVCGGTFKNYIPQLGGYNSETAGRQITELSYKIEGSFKDSESAELICNLIADLGYEVQEANIVSRTVADNDLSRNGVELTVKVENLKESLPILKELNLLDNSIEVENNIIKFGCYDLSENEVEKFYSNIKALYNKLDAKGINYESKGYSVESRYIDAQTRRTFYETWQKNAKSDKRGYRQDIYNLVSEAKEKLDNFLNKDVRKQKSLDSEGNELSKEQQEYFKDSKIRDEKGNLLVLYHGTTANFNIYDKKKLGKITGSDDAKLGFHLTDNKDLAKIFSELYSDELIYRITDEVTNDLGYDDVDEIERRLKEFATKNGNVKKQYLNVTKPLDITNSGLTNAHDIGYAINYALEGTKELNDSYDGVESYEDIADTLLSNYNGELAEIKKELATTKGALERLKELGYDGLILPITQTDSATLVNEYERGNKVRLDGKEYIVFESNQIKNTDNLNPTKNPDIRYQKDISINKEINPEESYVKGRKIPTSVTMAKDIKLGVKKNITHKLERVLGEKIDVDIDFAHDEDFFNTLGAKIKTINNQEEVGKVISDYMYNNMSVKLTLNNESKVFKISELYNQEELYKDIMNSNVRVFTFDHIVNLFKRKASSYCNALIYEKTFNRIQNSMRNTASKFQNKINKSGKGTSKELSEAVKQLGSLFAKKLDRTHFSQSARDIAKGMANIYDMDIKQSGKEEFGYYEDDTQRITPFGLAYNEEISTLLHEIGSGTNKLSLDELNFLYGFQKQVINSLLNTINDTAMVHNVEHKLSEDSKEFGDLVSNLKVYQPNMIMRAVKNYTNEVLDPHAIFSNLDGYKQNGYFSTVYKLMTEGQNIEYKVKMSLEDKIRDKLITKIGTESKYKKSLKNKIDLDLEDVNGDKVSVTKAQLITMYLTSQVESGDGHFYNARGGIDIAEENGRIRHISNKVLPRDENGNHTLTEYLESKLSQDDLDFCKSIADIMEESKGYLEDEQRALIGVSNMSDGFYFPTKGSPRSQSVNLSTEVSSFGDIDYVSKQSFVKSKVSNTGALLILNVDSIIQNYINGVARYSGYASTLDYVQRLLNTNYVDENGKNQTLSRLLKDKNISLKYLQEYLKDIQGVKDGRTDNFINKTLRGLRNASTTTVLGANLQVCLTQTASYWGAITYDVKLRNLLKAQAKGLTSKTTKQAKAYLMENSPYIKMRFRDNEIIKGNVVSDTINVVNKALMKGISFMDEQTILTQFVACEYEVQSRHKGDENYKFGTELNMQEAMKLHEEVVRGTQPNYNAVEKSSLQRSSNELVKGFARFTNQPTKTLSRIVESFGKWFTLSKEYSKAVKDGMATDTMRENLTKARKGFANSTTSFLAQSTMFILMIELFKRIKGKKEWDDVSVEEFASDFFSNSILGMFPVFKDIGGYMMNGYDLQAPSYANLTNLLSSIKTMTSAIQDGINGKDVNWSKPIRESTFAISEVLGLPTKNLYTYTYGLVKQFNPETAYKMRNVVYNSSQNYTKDFKEAISKGNTSMAQTILSTQINSRTGSNPSDKVIVEMIDLFKSGYENVIPNDVSKRIMIDGTEYELSKKQLETFKSNYSKANEKASYLINSTAYDKLSQEERNHALRGLYSAYYESSKSLLKEDYVSTNKLSYFVNATNINFSSLIASLSHIKFMTASQNQTKKELVQKYINSLSISKKEKYLLWVLSGHKLSDSQAKELTSYLKSLGLKQEQIDNIIKKDA